MVWSEWLEKSLKNPQWLRDIKVKNIQSLEWTLFSNKKYRDILFVDNGGWHFSYLKDAKGVKEKLRSIRHHVDYELNPVITEKLETMIKDKKLVYNYKIDQRSEDKFSDNEILENLDFSRLPKYLFENKNKYLQWFN